MVGRYLAKQHAHSKPHNRQAAQAQLIVVDLVRPVGQRSLSHRATDSCA